MSTIKIIVVTIVATFVAYGNVRTISALKFGVEQFLGRWYEIGRIAPPYAVPYPATCGRYDITRDHELTYGFTEEYKITINGRPKYYDGHGELVGSEMIVTIPDLKEENLIYIFAHYNNGTELIINRKDEKKYYGLLSRELEVSEVTRRLFDHLAAGVGVKAYYVPHYYCIYD